MDYLNQFNSPVNSFLSPLNNNYVSAFLRLFLVLYGGVAAPHLPNSVLKLFDNVAFRIFVLSLIVWTANHDPAISVLIAISFVVSVNTLQGKKPFEKFNLN